jgi:hypothetical protein
MSPDPLDLLWRCADNPTPALVLENLEAISQSDLDRLMELGLVRESATATHVICDACAEGHVEEVDRIEYADHVTRFFITCPENGRVEVPRERLMQWAVDYLPLFLSLSSALSASTGVTEVFPGRVWNLGRAALAGKSKTIWVARGLAWSDAAKLVDVLPKGRSPVLFFLGQPPDDNLLQVPRESIIELRTIISFCNEGIAVDVDGIKRQLVAEIAEVATKKPQKRASRAATIDAIKQALKEHLRAARDHAFNARDRGLGSALLPRPSQKQLAAQLNIHESSVSRAISDPSDKEIAILWEIANDLEQVMKFKG